MKYLVILSIITVLNNVSIAQLQNYNGRCEEKYNYQANWGTKIPVTTNNNMILPPRFRNGCYRAGCQERFLSAGYLNMGLGGSKGLTSGIGLNLIWSNNWGGSLSYNYLGREAKQLPSDYFAGLFGSNPNDKLNTFSVRILREFSTSLDQIRFGVEGGASIVKFQSAHFTYQARSGWLNLNSNYKVNYATKSSVGMSFRFKVEFPFTRFWGMELALISNINEYQSYAGFEIHTTIGKVRE